MFADVVARPGRKAIVERVEDLREYYRADIITMNAENVAGGFSITPPIAEEFFSHGIDLMTSGGIGDTAPDIISDQTEPEPLQVADKTDAAPVAAGWIVQIGAAPTETGARQLISGATAKLDSLNGGRPYVERFEKNGQVFYRARLDGFGGREDAAGLCNQLKKAKMSCLAMQS